jgi:hypothetical protein
MHGRFLGRWGEKWRVRVRRRSDVRGSAQGLAASEAARLAARLKEVYPGFISFKKLQIKFQCLTHFYYCLLPSISFTM